MIVELCAECGTPITDPDDLRRHPDTDRPYHWACLQEEYERERIADGAE